MSCSEERTAHLGSFLAGGLHTCICATTRDCGTAVIWSTLSGAHPPALPSAPLAGNKTDPMDIWLLGHQQECKDTKSTGYL